MEWRLDIHVDGRARALELAVSGTNWRRCKLGGDEISILEERHCFVHGQSTISTEKEIEKL
jgi:hypothetical protein